MAEILLVEDHESVAHCLKNSIGRNIGANVHHAESLDGALKLMEQIGVQQKKLFDALVCDTDLKGFPGEGDGILVAEAFKDNFPNGIVMGMSGVERPEWEGNCNSFHDKTDLILIVDALKEALENPDAYRNKIYVGKSGPKVADFIEANSSPLPDTGKSWSVGGIFRRFFG